MTPAEYYANEDVRARIREYCGADRADDPPTCLFVSALVPRPFVTWEGATRYSPVDLPSVLEAGHDVARSLWDRQSLLVHLDIDYMNPEHEADVFLRPERAYRILAPVAGGVRTALAAFRLPLLSLVTGRGYHFTGRVPLTDPVVPRLAALGRQATTRALDERLTPQRYQLRPPVLYDEAAAGLGLLLEHLGHRVMAGAAGSSTVPVVFNNTEVGRSGEGREAVSIDLSYLGDPLESRQIRMAFGTYQTPRVRPDIYRAAATRPPFAAVPWDGAPVVAPVEMRALEAAAAAAREWRVVLPDAGAGIEALLDDYLASRLRNFHRFYFDAAIHPIERWGQTYDTLDVQALPPCVVEPIRRPNDALLKPEVLQHLTRALLADGWHPRHVAGLVISRYARDHGWGDRWRRIDPARRADFDVRIFSGLLAAGLDRGIDFNCVSAQEKHLCPGRGCRHDLRGTRDRLLQRMVV